MDKFQTKAGTATVGNIGKLDEQISADQVGALAHTHSSRLIPKVPKSMLKAMGTMWALIKSNQVE